MNKFDSKIEFIANQFDVYTGDKVKRLISKHLKPLIDAHIQEDELDERIDAVYDILEGFIRDGNLDAVNAWLETIDVTKSEPEISIAALIATLPARNRLEARPAFVERVKKYAKILHEDPKEWINGLE